MNEHKSEIPEELRAFVDSKLMLDKEYAAKIEEAVAELANPEEKAEFRHTLNDLLSLELSSMVIDVLGNEAIQTMLALPADERKAFIDTLFQHGANLESGTPAPTATLPEKFNAKIEEVLRYLAGNLSNHDPN